ncbi:MAG TPA: SDR family oxidoreductase [Rhodothermales bacterium]|nr:SDR family oxidoreductase [Rhodothermales bacterium]
MAAPNSAALVTGASSGIGLEFARLLAAEGRDLLLVARSQDRLEEIKDELVARHGVIVRCLAVDLTHQDAAERVANAAAGLFVDLLINNAGVGVLGRFHETNRDDQLNLTRLNVDAVVELTHRFVGPMIEHGQGGVLNVASMAGFTPGPLMSTYYASKAFVVSFTEALALELRDTGVTVSALCPGPVPTNFQARAGIVRKGSTVLPSLSARYVAEAGLKGLRAGKTVVVPGLLNKVLVAVMRVTPRRMSAAAVHKVQTSRTGEQRE